MPGATHPDPSLLSPARPSILLSQSNSDMSTTSSESKPSSITFAPLPCIETRKRRNSRPIGIAGRAEMLRRHRRQFSQPGDAYDGQPPPPDSDDIPLPDIGKLVKELWRTVSQRQGAKDRNGREASPPPPTITTTAEGRTPEDEGEGSVWMEEITWSPPSDAASTFFAEDHAS